MCGGIKTEGLSPGGNVSGRECLRGNMSDHAAKQDNIHLVQSMAITNMSDVRHEDCNVINWLSKFQVYIN